MTIARFFIAIGVAFYLSKHGLEKKSLSLSGALAAFVVGFLTLFNTSYVFAAMLLLHYFSSSRLTKLKAEQKRILDKDYTEGGQRDAIQVLCNSITGTVAAMLYELCSSASTDACVLIDDDYVLHRAFIFMALGHYACCIGDTWASEIGILSKIRPKLITTQQHVPHGTNGAVSLDGILASAYGGALMGFVTSLVLYIEGRGCAGSIWILWITLFGLAGGLGGSILDSLLGAEMQVTLYDTKTNQVTNKPGPDVEIICGQDVLSNNTVNLVSSLGSAVILGVIGLMF